MSRQQSRSSHRQRRATLPAPGGLRRTAASALAAAAVAVILVASDAGLASAHTNDGASLPHIVVEIGRWGLGLSAIIAVLVATLWIRARLLGRDR